MRLPAAGSMDNKRTNSAVNRRDRAILQANKDQEVRQRLFDQAAYGELTGEQADAEAERLGLGKLSHQPDPDDFDPMKEGQWTLSMAVAWIAFRTPEMVRQSWDKYRAGYTYWKWSRWRNGPDGPISEGWHLQTLGRQTLSLLGIASYLERDKGRDPDFSMTVREAIDALWIALKTDCFSATGIDQETGQRGEIVPMAWIELQPYVEGDEDEVRPTLLGRSGPGRYRDVLISSGSVTLLWPAPFKSDDARLPPTVDPVGDGYMPLYLAAQWIATEGGKQTFEPSDLEFWRPAYSALMDAIASDRVRVVGTKGGNRGPVEGFHFADCIVDYPFTSASLDLMLSSETYLQSHPYIDAEHWRGGFDDSLVNRRGTLWSRLMVAKSDVREIWPFAPAEIPRTGTAGRPALSIHLVFDELERRAIAGTMLNAVSKESAELVEWLKVAHATMPRPTPKTVENQIRSRYRELKSTRNNRTGDISG